MSASVTTQIWVVRLIGNQSEVLPRSGYWRGISMKFLRSFLSRHFAGKLVLAIKERSFIRLFFFLILAYFTLFCHEDSTRRQGMKQDLRPNWYQPFHYHLARERLYHATGATPLNLYEQHVGSFTSQRIRTETLWVVRRGLRFFVPIREDLRMSHS